MTLALLQFLASAVVIVIAGTYLSKFADEIAELTGLGRLLIGSVLLAGATSLPELTVDIAAVRNGMADIAFGDLVGSSLFNLLILAILDLSVHSRGRMLSRMAAGHALSGGVSASLTAIAALCLMTQSISGRDEVAGISYGLWLVLAGYLMGIRMIYYDQQFVAAQSPPTDSAGNDSPNRSWRGPVMGFVICATVIVFAGPFLADAAGKIADASGLGKSFIGTTLVAFSTSLPELVTSLAALRMGAHDLAIGNVFGSNAFNMILFLPLDLVHPGPLLAAVSSQHAITAVAAIWATLVVMLGQLYQVERRRRIIEPDALLVIGIVFGTLLVIYTLGA